MSTNCKDLKDKIFGRLTVVSQLPTVPRPGRRGGRSKWKCQCECGTYCEVLGQSLTGGLTRSCGCLHKERITTHGHSRNGKSSPTFKSWLAMFERCLNPNDPNYGYYGGRGIKICESWRGAHGFENFLAAMGEKPLKKTLDRIDTNGNYEPSNCRWATGTEQSRNRRCVTPPAIVATIKNLQKRGLQPLDIHRQINKVVKVETIRNIMRGKTWKDMTAA